MSTLTNTDFCLPAKEQVDLEQRRWAAPARWAPASRRRALTAVPRLRRKRPERPDAASSRGKWQWRREAACAWRVHDRCRTGVVGDDSSAVGQMSASSSDGPAECVFASEGITMTGGDENLSRPPLKDPCGGRPGGGVTLPPSGSTPSSSCPRRPCARPCAHCPAPSTGRRASSTASRIPITESSFRLSAAAWTSRCRARGTGRPMTRMVAVGAPGVVDSGLLEGLVTPCVAPAALLDPTG